MSAFSKLDGRLVRLRVVADPAGGVDSAPSDSPYLSCRLLNWLSILQQVPTTENERWMRQAIDLAVDNVRSGRGGPFGALVVKENRLLASGVNLVAATNDPTAHAEVVAIRAACQELGAFQLRDCELYASCEPCPMCLGAVYWARPKAFYFSISRQAAAAAGFDDARIYDELTLAPAMRSIPGFCVLPDCGGEPFEEWARAARKIPY
jgi:guanine deaminase